MASNTIYLKLLLCNLPEELPIGTSDAFPFINFVPNEVVLARFGSVRFREPFMRTLNRTSGPVRFLFWLHNQWFGSCSVQVRTGSNHIVSVYRVSTDLNTKSQKSSSSSPFSSSKLCQNLSSSSRTSSRPLASLTATIVLDL